MNWFRNDWVIMFLFSNGTLWMFEGCAEPPPMKLLYFLVGNFSFFVGIKLLRPKPKT